MKKLALLIILTILSLQVSAQDNGRRFTYGDLNFIIDPNLPQNLTITNYAAEALDNIYPGGPQPARTEFVFYTAPPAPQYVWDADMVIYLYRTEDLAAYIYHDAEYQSLQTILREHPELSSFESLEDYRRLPELPISTSVQVMRAYSQYRENCVYKGISYLTYHSADVSPFLPNGFTYSFQAISVDGQYYISASFRLTTSLFPSKLPADFDYDTFVDNYDTYMAESIATLATASPDDFSPSLTTLDSFIDSINFGGAITECF